MTSTTDDQIDDANIVSETEPAEARMTETPADSAPPAAPALQPIVLQTPVTWASIDEKNNLTAFNPDLLNQIANDTSHENNPVARIMVGVWNAASSTTANSIMANMLSAAGEDESLKAFVQTFKDKLNPPKGA